MVALSPACETSTGEPLTTALQTVADFLQQQAYEFTCVTPATHARVLDLRNGQQAQSLRDIFGWNMPFRAGMLPAAIQACLEQSGLVHAGEDAGKPPASSGEVRWTCCVRFASQGADLIAHEGFPTLAHDAVFYGPDTFRFCRAIRQHLRPGGLVVDIGCGSGAGAIVAAQVGAAQVIASDINSRALAFAEANVQTAGLSGTISMRLSDLLLEIRETPTAIIANPPFIVDSKGRSYRDGGGDLGIDLSLAIVSAAAERLPRGGQLIVYTGAPVVDGVDYFRAAAEPILHQRGLRMHYEEIDPDIFGDELSSPSYTTIDGIERIAAVLLVAQVP